MKAEGPFFDHDVNGFHHLVGDCGEKVDAEGLVGQFPHATHLLPNAVRSFGNHAEGSVATGFRNSGAYVGVGDAAHACEEDGHVDVEEVADRGLYRHCPTVTQSNRPGSPEA